jgi:aspartate-semialdehyde dehydrogenase
MKIAVVGATGMVGRVILQVLKERQFPADEIIAVASAKSAGQEREINGETYRIYSMEEAIEAKPELALFSAGGVTSRDWAPRFAKAGIRVIDNSSAWRMSPMHKLIIPEVNGPLLTADDMIIANPNCSTIQLVMVLWPLHKLYGINRVIVSTYQSVSGSGKKAMAQLENEREGKKGEMAYPYPIDSNCIPHCDVFEEDGYTKEELKLSRETVKIMDDKAVKLSATAVRVPVTGGHSEAVNISFDKDFDLAEIRKTLHETPGLAVQDNPEMNIYPMPRMAEGKDDVFVGRIRRDFTAQNTLNCWIVADNLRKGAATNAVQIAELLREMIV